ncbi:low affinity immunoglobulin gamma Fc region receptor II-b isoform X1 [Ochotona princeps]|uniref:low affinity immunoglobulin gamma Fc region receptor II-b isoform X1 n=1 Tax=Ochotona princeps TaxID=9978 RepID=UPI002714C2C5|nr:low affinity immunoglobulin gamma Fc region receptor II-b isoform X1 [Ochotona princeps]
MTLKSHMFQHVASRSLWLLQPLMTLLLLAPVDKAAADLPKAVVELQPPWIHVLREDRVTLTCQGAHSPGNQSTQWLHNGSPIPTQVQPSYTFKAESNDSGEYRCRTDRTSLSNPLQLDVTAEWLLLQTPQLVFQEGESIVLRCHSWRNNPMNKVTFYQNGTAKKFSHYNTTFFIAEANSSHSGDYHCTGRIGNTFYSSKSVTITVRKILSTSNDSLVVTIVAVVAGIVAVATIAVLAVFIYLRRRRSSALSGNSKLRGMGETLPEELGEYSVLYGGSAMPHPGLPEGLEPAASNLSSPIDREEADKAEVENTITYSLLMHPEAAEEDIEPNYQNHN